MKYYSLAAKARIASLSYRSKVTGRDGMMTMRYVSHGLGGFRRRNEGRDAMMAPRRLERAWRAAAAAASALAFGSVAACANAGPYNPDNLPSAQAAYIGQICQSVMRLQPSGEQYQSCVDSLMDSAKNLNSAQAMQQARVSCFGKGLRPGEPGFGECELQSAEVQPVRTTTTWAAATNDAALPGGTKSYFYASPRDVFRREQLACARLGFDPADGGFGSCVAGLESSMFEADNPSQ